ncbi:MAG: hypothetical protein SFW67_30505, partial [Myxococcaceae bacterium]|nr:hypothetical protein [Myxococcaceae bacterium]
SRGRRAPQALERHSARLAALTFIACTALALECALRTSRSLAPAPSRANVTSPPGLRSWPWCWGR